METYASSKTQSWLSWFFRGLVVLGVIVLIGRLAELQIIKGAYFRGLAEGNRIRRVSISAPRGAVLARGGEVLVGNRETKYTVSFNPESGYEKVPAKGDTSSDEIISEWARVYPLGSNFAHVSGYLGETNEFEVAKVVPECIEKGVRALGSLIGRSGLEQQYDCELRGIDGEELVEVDNFGLRIRTLGRKTPLPGSDIRTTIDFNLQKKVAEALSTKKGAIVVTDIKGEVLALYSSPSFDPDNITLALDDLDLPLFNRAIGGAYPPGSIYKIVTSTAALEENKIDKDYKYEDTGSVRISDEFVYFNWYFTQYGGVEGLIDLPKALARSTDTFFYKVGELVGVDALNDWSFDYGLGAPTGIDLPGEIKGFVPTPAWKKAVKGERWFLGNTYHIAIGQGDLTTTPIQANGIASVIATGGNLCQPYLVGDESNCHELDISRRSIDLIKEGMIAACAEGGTAFPFFDFEPAVACKTGTAETFEEDVTHAWFVVFGPAEFPEIVVSVLLEKGGEGSRDAAPVAKEIFDYWFHERIETNP